MASEVLRAGRVRGVPRGGQHLLGVILDSSGSSVDAVVLLVHRERLKHAWKLHVAATLASTSLSGQVLVTFPESTCIAKTAAAAASSSMPSEGVSGVAEAAIRAERTGIVPDAR